MSCKPILKNWPFALLGFEHLLENLGFDVGHSHGGGHGEHGTHSTDHDSQDHHDDGHGHGHGIPDPGHMVMLYSTNWFIFILYFIIFQSQSTKHARFEKIDLGEHSKTWLKHSNIVIVSTFKD